MMRSTLVSVALVASLGACASQSQPQPQVAPAPPPPAAPAPAPTADSGVTTKATPVNHVTIAGDHLEIDQHIHFATGKGTIEQDSFALLNEIAQVLKTHPEITALHIIGHTDHQGGHALNQKLSEDRAKSVYEYLKAQGVTQPIDHKGVGETDPACTEDTEMCHQKNRRVEFKIDKS